MNNTFSGLSTIIPKGKRITFNDSDEEKKEKYDPMHDMNFEKALRKNNIFSGKEGRMMFELQQQAKGDQRFGLTKSFKGDMNKEQVSKSLKSITDAFDEEGSNTKTIEKKGKKDNKIYYEEEEIKNESRNNLSLLSSMLPNSEFLNMNTTKKQVKASDLVVKRFDPFLGIGVNLQIENSDSEDELVSKIHTSKLNKGFAPLIQKEVVNKNNTKQSKQSNDKELANVINHIQDKELKQTKVEVNFDFFRGLTNKETKPTTKNESIKKEMIQEKQSKQMSKEDKEEAERRLLQKKRRKEELAEKRNSEKAKEKEKLVRQDKLVRKKLSKDGVTEDKIDNYMRMISLVTEKKYKIKQN